MSSWARPGVKCVCIAENGSWFPAGHDSAPQPNFPAFGDVLFIRETYVSNGTLYLEFPDIDAGFSARCFKPVIEQVDDLALFTHHLKRVGEPA